ncbi:solute carrier family 22 member 15-like [Oculina patagonica]
MELTTDEFLEEIGSFGRYQILLSVFCNLVYMLWWGIPVMSMLFIASEPGWKCKNNNTCPFTETIRLGDDNYSYRCDIAREDWEFGDDFTSVVTEFDLVCDRGSLGFVSTSVIFVGFFIGSICVSSISDKFGRKYPVYICGFLCCVFNFASAFSPAYWVFATFRFIIGFMIGALSIPIFVMGTEYSGIRHRGIAGSLIWNGFMAAILMLAGLAYLIRDWKQLTMVTGAPGILLMGCWFFTPESVRWFLKKGRVADAREALSKVARVNGKEMPDAELKLPKDETKERLGDIRDLFSSAKMTHKTLASWLMWFTASFISWGTSFSAPFLGGNIYVNVIISALTALPAYPIVAGLTVKVGRRKIILWSFLFAAVGAVGALLLSDKAEHDKGYLIGKIFMYMFVANLCGDIAFAVVYVYSAELFPTTLRNVGMGTSTAIARVSAFVSAYFPLLLTVNRLLPFGIMGGLALASAIVCMTLPETHNEPTMEDLYPEDKSSPNEKSNLVAVADEKNCSFDESRL